MKIMVVSCEKYSDAWKPFFELFKKFWPDCPYETWLVTDCDVDKVPWDLVLPGVGVSAGGSHRSWCGVVEEFVRVFCNSEPVLMLQEDFFFSGPVHQDLIDQALELYGLVKAGCVRLYPCPGPNEIADDCNWGIVHRGQPYRISCQAAIWRPSYLQQIASQFKTPQEFELQGTPYSCTLPDNVWSYGRDRERWPINYICTAIVRGVWQKGAKDLCDAHGIQVDWSKRPREWESA